MIPGVRPRFWALYVLQRLVGDERPEAVVRFLLESRRVVLAQPDDVGGMGAVHQSAMHAGDRDGNGANLSCGLRQSYASGANRIWST
jgi:hypothetical protein